MIHYAVHLSTWVILEIFVCFNHTIVCFEHTIVHSVNMISLNYHPHRRRVMEVAPHLYFLLLYCVTKTMLSQRLPYKFWLLACYFKPLVTAYAVAYGMDYKARLPLVVHHNSGGELRVYIPPRTIHTWMAFPVFYKPHYVLYLFLVFCTHAGNLLPF